MACLLLAAVAFGAGWHTKTFTAQSATGTTAEVVDFDTVRLSPDELTVQLNVTGAPTTCTYQVEGSLDNVTFFDLSGAKSCTSSLMFHLDSKPVRYLRGNLTALSGGTSPSVQLIVKGVSR